MDTRGFDRRIKHHLARQFNLPEEQVETMLPEFKKTLSQHMENLARVQSEEELPALARAAHTIKGAFLNLGLEDCAQLALQIEGGATREDMSMDYAALIDDMEALVESIVRQ